MTTAAELNEWVSTLEAVHLIAPRVGGDKAAKKAIVERLRDCSIQARAWWVAQAIDIGRPYVEPVLSVEWNDGEQPPEMTSSDWQQMRRSKSKPVISQTRVGDAQAFDVRENPMLGCAFWRDMKKADLRRWDWTSGFCLASYPAGTVFTQCEIENYQRWPIRMFALGVEFSKSDIKKIAARVEVQPQQLPFSARGRPPSSRTANWVAELVLLHSEEGIELLTASGVCQQISERLARQGLQELSPSSAQPIAKRVIEALRSKPKTPNR